MEQRQQQQQAVGPIDAHIVARDAGVEHDVANAERWAPF
jgi:hypothetical protein